MFKLAKAFSSFSTNDIEQARIFYTETLGLDVTDDPMGFVSIRLANGGEVIIYPKPNHVPATFTVLSFFVDDIERAVDDLVESGIEFEQYGGENQTDEKGIARGEGPLIAWFKDPAGNILAVLQEN